MCQSFAPLRGRVIFHGVERPHSFACLSIDGHLGCSYLSVPVNEAVGTRLCSSWVPAQERGRWVKLRKCRLSLKAAAPFTVLANSAWGSRGRRLPRQDLLPSDVLITGILLDAKSSGSLFKPLRPGFRTTRPPRPGSPTASLLPRRLAPFGSELSWTVTACGTDHPSGSSCTTADSPILEVPLPIPTPPPLETDSPKERSPSLF